MSDLKEVLNHFGKCISDHFKLLLDKYCQTFEKPTDLEAILLYYEWSIKNSE
jgi:hypothetical protein